MSSFRKFLRRADADDLLELFLLVGVITILVVRAGLAATGYPQLGSSMGLHIAHMLWGGLLLVLAFILAIGFIGRGPRRLAALLGGVGFGLFIDEVGKFVTRDNDYFFRPSFAIIYFVFMLIYLGTRMFHESRLRTEECAANALDISQDALAGDMDAHDKARALAMAHRAGRTEMGQKLAAFVSVLDTRPAATSFGRRWQMGLRRDYREMVSASWFETMIIVFFALSAVAKLVLVPRILTGSGLPLVWLGAFVIMLLTAQDGRMAKRKKRVALFGLAACLFALLFISAMDDLSLPRLGFADWGEITSTILMALCVIIGIYRLHSSHLVAYVWFRRGALIAVFLTQFFLFYRLQLLALPSLIVNLAVITALDYGLQEERRILHEGVAARA